MSDSTRLGFVVRTLWVRLSGRPWDRAEQSLRPASRRASHRARVAVLVGLLLTLAAQVGLGWAIHTERVPLRDPIYFDKLAILREKPAFFTATAGDRPTTVLFLGSSRTLNAFNAGAATEQLTHMLGRPVQVFNFGQAGAGPVTNAVYLHRLRQEGVNPDVVVIEVHPVFLAGHRPDPPETRWLLPIRLRPEELPLVREMGFPAETPAVHGPRGFLASWHEYRFLFVDRYLPFLLMDDRRLNGGHVSDAYGFARLQDHAPKASDRARLLAMARGQYSGEFDGYRPNGIGVGAIRHMLQQCRDAGIRAALVLMPESEEWRAWYPEAGLAELDTVLAGLSAEYGVPVFDARTWVPLHMSVDGHHLTGPGADLLTERLTREALAPWLANNPTPHPRTRP